MTQTTGRAKRTAGAFDIRNIIGGLIGIYGIVLVSTGIVARSDEDLAKADGFNINLWAGIAMVVVAVAFIAWSVLRPVVVPPEVQPADNADGTDTKE